MTVTRQPAQVGRLHRGELPGPLILPPNLGAHPRGSREHRRVLLPDPLVGADVDHHTGAIRPAGEVIRGMPHRPARLRGPVQPHRLRGRPHHLRVGVQSHQPIPLQPGLVPHMLTSRGEPPQARPVALPAERREPADRGHPLKRQIPATAQRLALQGTVTADELDLNACDRARLPPRRDRTRHQAPHDQG
jgi:hypothetical protein